MVDIFKYLHLKNIAHRDLKPENILLDEKMHLKLSDFGSAKFCPPPQLKTSKVRRGTLVGTQDYGAPEILLTQESGTSADLWSLGCVAYELFVGKPPFKSNQEGAAFEKILWGDFVFPEDFPELAKDLCKKLIELEKDKRLGTSDFEKLKQHEFFAGIDFDDLKRNELFLGLSKNSQINSTPNNGSIKNEINYAVISLEKSYEIDFNYFSFDDPSFDTNKDHKCDVNIIKEGILRKKGKWKMYQKVRLVLTDEPRLVYYNDENIPIVYYIKNIGRYSNGRTN